MEIFADTISYCDYEASAPTFFSPLWRGFKIAMLLLKGTLLSSSLDFEWNYREEDEKRLENVLFVSADIPGKNLESVIGRDKG